MPASKTAEHNVKTPDISMEKKNKKQPQGFQWEQQALNSVTNFYDVD